MVTIEECLLFLFQRRMWEIIHQIQDDTKHSELRIAQYQCAVGYYEKLGLQFEPISWRIVEDAIIWI